MTEASNPEVSEEEDVLRCAFGDGRRATKTLQVEQQSILMTCAPCEKELLAGHKNKRCQFCGIPINKNWKRSALPGFYHTRNCPRAEK